ncbi:hypothetical protein Cni_G21982 [Canna indica]|uniref:Uncharacterized protein n=1 Tax=Canna indica TaxID=4628 RepID=A0AAQ3QKT6_9LILI|nr:hypothetical protein Cni_G21982 [Canna indica]
MRSKRNATIRRGEKLNHFRGDGPNWVLIAGGALLSTLSIRLGCKLKQALLPKQEDAGNMKFTPKRMSGAGQKNSNLCKCNQDDDTRYHCLSAYTTGISDGMDIKQSKIPMSTEIDVSLPLVKFAEEEPNKDNGSMIWASSPERLELPQKPFHHSSSSDSPCFSESASDIYSKREVIQKLRQQLKRRDDVIMEMQAQITDLQHSLSIQMTQSGHLQAQIDAANRDLFDSLREIQRLRKIIADYCVAEVISPEKPARLWCPEVANGVMNGHADSADDLKAQGIGVERGIGDLMKVEMLKKEVGELMEVIEGKNFLIQSYREQKVELCSKMEELQLKLNSHVPNIL